MTTKKYNALAISNDGRPTFKAGMGSQAEAAREALAWANNDDNLVRFFISDGTEPMEFEIQELAEIGGVPADFR